MFRMISALLLSLVLSAPGYAQTAPDRNATGGAQTLQDILARQRGEPVDNNFRRDNLGDAARAKAIGSQLSTLGGASDPELWRALRFGEADITVSTGKDVDKMLVQDGGMTWLKFREGPLRSFGANILILAILALGLFYMIRDRIPLEGDRTGRTITRFKFIERFAHWMLAGSFILLGLTGLFTLFGRVAIAPYLGHEFNSTLLIASKWIHNNVSWAFMAGLIMVFVMWVWHNIPNRTDITWIRQAGGIIGSAHPPAKKFNAGQKVVFWSVILLGGSISVSGLSLLFPFEIPIFAKTFGALNSIGAPGWFGMADLPTNLSPHAEMQLSQIWHALVAFVLMAIIIAHIYIGSLGMEGAYEAMGSGEVDEAWAKQHHSIWLEDVKSKAPPAPTETTPAE